MQTNATVGLPQKEQKRVQSEVRQRSLHENAARGDKRDESEIKLCPCD